jgi:hypothetical protein
LPAVQAAASAETATQKPIEFSRQGSIHDFRKLAGESGFAGGAFRPIRRQRIGRLRCLISQAKNAAPDNSAGGLLVSTA